MPKRKKKRFSKPRKIFDIAILKEENGLINKYGLKSRREVWRADFAVGKIRSIAKSLITADDKSKNEFVERQREKGFPVSSIADVLGLSKEDILKRRLQSIVVKKGLAHTYKQARQFINHKHILINGKSLDSPSHLTTLKEESSVELTLELPQKEILSDEEKSIIKQIKPKEENNE